MKKKIILGLLGFLVFLVPSFSSAIMTTVDNPFVNSADASLPRTYDKISVQYGNYNWVSRGNNAYTTYYFISPIIFGSPVGGVAKIFSPSANHTYAIMHNYDTQDRAHCQLFFDFDFDNGGQKCVLSAMGSPIVIDGVELYNYGLTSVGWFFYNVKNGPLFEIKDLYHLIGNKIYKNIFVDVDTSYTLTIKDLNVNKEFKRYNILDKDSHPNANFKHYRFLASMGGGWFEDFVATHSADSTFELQKNPLGNNLFFNHIDSYFYGGLIDHPVSVNYTRGGEIASGIWTPSEGGDTDGDSSSDLDWTSYNQCVGYWEDIRIYASYSRNCYLDLANNDLALTDWINIDSWYTPAMYPEDPPLLPDEPVLENDLQTCIGYKATHRQLYLKYGEQLFSEDETMRQKLKYNAQQYFLTYNDINPSTMCASGNPTNQYQSPISNEESKKWYNFWQGFISGDHNYTPKDIFDNSGNFIGFPDDLPDQVDWSAIDNLGENFNIFGFVGDFKNKFDSGSNVIGRNTCSSSDPFQGKLDIIVYGFTLIISLYILKMVKW